MNVLDSIYIHYYKWYDRDGIGMKKENAPQNSALLLGITIMVWDLFITVCVFKLTSVPFSSFSKYLILIGSLIIIGLCYKFYFYNNPGFSIYHSDLSKDVKELSKGKLIIYILSLNFLPLILVGRILWLK